MSSSLRSPPSVSPALFLAWAQERQVSTLRAELTKLDADLAALGFDEAAEEAAAAKQQALRASLVRARAKEEEMAGALAGVEFRRETQPHCARSRGSCARVRDRVRVAACAHDAVRLFARMPVCSPCSLGARLLSLRACIFPSSPPPPLPPSPPPSLLG
eukprot:3531672-Pleurochrysis_carterae.AAC.1